MPLILEAPSGQWNPMSGVTATDELVNAPVAQLDRAIASGAIGQAFESPRAHIHFHTIQD